MKIVSFSTLDSLSPLKNGKNRLMGIDLGSKTIGISTSDTTWFIATPLTLIRRTNTCNDLNALSKIIQEYEVAGIVIGYPLNMNGTEGPQGQKIKIFIEHFSESNPTPIVLWDERLSTVAVTKTLLKADMSRKRRSEVVDKMAASYILQGALDYLRRAQSNV